MAKKKRVRGPKGLPWYAKSRDVWVVPGDPKKTALRDDRGIIRGNDSAAEARAMAAWHATAVTAPGRLDGGRLVADVLQAYLLDCHSRGVSDKRVQQYRADFSSFKKHYPSLTVADLHPDHIRRWWDAAHPEWGAGTRNLAGCAFKAATKWAAAAGRGRMIPTDPLAGMALPAIPKRTAESVVSDEEFEGLLAVIKADSLRDILRVLWESGTRPVNLFRATAANVAADGRSLYFDAHNTAAGSAVHKTFKRTGRGLSVPLPGAAAEVVARLVAKYPTGPLFRTSRGGEWTAVKLATMVAHYAKQVGLDGRFTPYSCRHSRATDLLEQGLPSAEVAAMLGHTRDVLLDRYSHVAANAARLADRMDAARSNRPAGD